MTPKFTHDCTTCKYLGHYFNHDVYYCPGDTLFELGTMIARRSSDPPDYSSQPLYLLQSVISDPNHKIRCDHEDWTMAYMDYIFSDKCLIQHKAMIVGLIAKCHEMFRDDNGHDKMLVKRVVR